MKKAQWVLAVLTGVAIALSAMCLRSDGMLTMDPIGNAVMVLFWFAIPATWFLVGLRANRGSTIGFCLLMAVYYCCGLLCFLLMEGKSRESSGGRIFAPILLLMGAPFLVVFESYARKFVVWLYARSAAH